MLRPFERLPLRLLAERPAPHPFFETPERRVTVHTPALGHTTASVRVLGSGPPLLLIHGLMTTGYSWREVLAPLSERYTLLVPDLVGAGRSIAPGAPLCPEAVADWLAALLTALDVEKTAAVGNSMGGYLGLWLALRHPHRLRRLLIMHAPGLPEPRLRLLGWLLRLPGARALLRALVQRDAEAWVWRNVHYWDESKKSIEELREYGAPLNTEAGLEGFLAQLRDMMSHAGTTRLEAALRALPNGPAVPLRLLYARRDPMVPPAMGPRLRALLPGVGLDWAEEGGHFLHVDRPALFLQLATPFLDGADIAPDPGAKPRPAG